MFDNPLSALAGAPPEPQQPAQQGTPAPINETAAPQQPEPMKPGVAPTQTFTNAPKQSLWMNVVQGALQGLAASGGATSFGGGLGRGAAGQMAAQRQQVMDEEEIKFKNQQAAAAASVAARQNFELTKLKQDAKIAADNHSIGLINWYSKTFGYVPAWVSDDDSESAMAGLKHLSKSHEGGVPSVFTLHLNDAGEKGKIVGFTLPPPDQQLNFVNYARKAEGVPKLTEQQWRALDGDKQEQYIHNANNLWFPSDLSEDKLPGAIARYKGLRETYVQRGDGTTPEERSEVAQKFDDVIGMLQAIQGDHVTRKLDLRKKEAEITESTKAKYKTSSDSASDTDDDNSIVAGMLDGSLDITKTASIRSGRREHLIALAKQRDPNFNMMTYNQRLAVNQKFTSGKAADQISSLNTFAGHVGDASQLVNALRNEGSPWINKPMNAVRKGLGNEAIGPFQAALEAAKDEYLTFLKAGHAPQKSEVDLAENLLNTNMTPAQLQSTLKQMGHTVLIRANSLNSEYRRTFGKDYPMLSDHAKQALSNLGLKEIGSGSQSSSQNDGTVRIQASDGRIHRIPKDKLSAAQQRDPGAKVVN
jgi:hypothetical protein